MSLLIPEKNRLKGQLAYKILATSITVYVRNAATYVYFNPLYSKHSHQSWRIHQRACIHKADDKRIMHVFIFSQI